MEEAVASERLRKLRQFILATSVLYPAFGVAGALLAYRGSSLTLFVLLLLILASFGIIDSYSYRSLTKIEAEVASGVLLGGNLEARVRRLATFLVSLGVVTAVVATLFLLLLLEA